MKQVTLICALVGAQVVLGAVLYDQTVFPEPFKLLSDVPDPDEIVSFHVVLHPRGREELHRALMDVSNPRSENYGKYWTREQVRAVADYPFSHPIHRAVADWVDRFGKGAQVDFNGDNYHFVTTVETAERLFDTKLMAFERSATGERLVKFFGTLSLPADVLEHTSMVTGITEFPSAPLHPQSVEDLLARAGIADDDEGQGGCNVPYTVKNMYNMDQNAAATQASSVAPYSRNPSDTRDIGFGEDDLATWESVNSLPNNPVNNIIGDNSAMYTSDHTPLAGLEALLDVQMISAYSSGFQGPGANQSFYIQKGWIYEFANYIYNNPGSPWINSMSYGYEETNQCAVGNCDALSSFPDSQGYVYATDSVFLKLGLLGYTMIAASGDNGVEPNRRCSKMFQVYPAGSNYVLAVGATTVIKSDTSVPVGSDAPPSCCDSTSTSPTCCECSTSQDEVSVNHRNNGLFDAGGGFSHYNPRQEWQEQAVLSYLNSDVSFPDSKYWNSTNRGYPDVTAIGANVAVIKDGKLTLEAGTSASAPLWAGLLSIINDDRFAAGKSPLGFVNPALYFAQQESPETFNDITVGTNGGVHYIGSGSCDNLSFSATTGWDAVTGLGSPNFDNLREFFTRIV
eukprot:CAMPEP_0119133096 /NCGR_PEP_ID=MMETSP1310-20130426/12960_1 /TAXON_ID=464262 /ORGANISM="Genus nov. species nov., Strain RCC2339" /LENGTH=624 /DNA_ID=CAMNT_0007123771 /DNA_START=43 /DNA_END=1917 /DNA_ORIENTATION=+